MPWHALDAVDDAFEETRSFLLPFERARWLRLAVVSLFVGGGYTVFNWAQQVPVDPVVAGPTDPERLLPSLDPFGTTLVVGVALLVLGFAVCGPVMRFVLLDALRTDEVRLRGPFRRRLWDGLQLLVLPLGVGILLVTTGAALSLALITGGPALSEQIPTSAGSLAGFAVLFAGLVGSVVALFSIYAFFNFSTAFVAPTMVALDADILAAWGRVFGLIRAHTGQFVGYLVARLFLFVAIWVVWLVVLAVTGVVAVLVTGFAAVGASAALGGVEAALGSIGGQVLLGGVVAVGALAFLVFVYFPLRIAQLTFFTTYELSFLGGVDPRLDLLRDERSGGAVVDHGETEGETDDQETGGFVFGNVRERPVDAKSSDGLDSSRGTGPAAVDAETAEGDVGAEEDDIDNRDDSDDSDDSDDGNNSDDGDDEFSTPYWYG